MKETFLGDFHLWIPRILMVLILKIAIILIILIITLEILLVIILILGGIIKLLDVCKR